MPLRGLTVNGAGQLVRDGVRFRNIGLNYGGAIQRIYSQPSATACAYTPGSEQDAMLDFAQSMKVKVLRVKATPYWPAQWRYGVNGGVAGVAAIAADRAAHYAQIDAFIAKCRARDIGVILTLFFRHASPCDLAGQTVRAGWLSAGATRTYVTSVTQEIVTRYLTEDAVLGYEWSNEVNHYNDAADAAFSAFPGTNTGYGSAASYTAANTAFNGLDLSDVLTWWTGIVRAVDAQRIVLTGNGPNSYSQPGGAAGISTPMSAWHREQVRDNPTNCGSIHFYGNVNLGSPGLRGLDPVLTGVRHWQRMAGRGFVLGEFGNQPWQINTISTAGGVATISCAASLPADVGDRIGVSGTGTALDGQWLTVSTINAGRDTITAPTSIAATYSGSVKGLKSIDGGKLARMCDDIINSGTDVALWWMLDGDTGRPVGESINDADNAELRTAILAANTRLGW
jgi:hypothetical protein